MSNQKTSKQTEKLTSGTTFDLNKATPLTFAVLSLVMCWNRIKRSELGTDIELLSVSEMKQETVLKIIRAETSFVKETGFNSFIHDSAFLKTGKFFDELYACNNPKIMESLHLFLEALLEQFNKKVKSMSVWFQTFNKDKIDKIRNSFLVTTVESKHELVVDLVNLFKLDKSNSLEVNRIFFFIFMSLFMIIVI